MGGRGLNWSVSVYPWEPVRHARKRCYEDWMESWDIINFQWKKTTIAKLRFFCNVINEGNIRRVDQCQNVRFSIFLMCLMSRASAFRGRVARGVDVWIGQVNIMFFKGTILICPSGWGCGGSGCFSDRFCTGASQEKKLMLGNANKQR